MVNFIAGFQATAEVLLLVAGGAAAVMIAVVVILLAGIVMGAVFDAVTNVMAKRWCKSGHQPRNKLERIIMENPKRLER